MKKELILFVCLSLIFGCQHSRTYTNLIEIDSLLRQEMVDSAIQKIQTIVIDSNDKEATAYYYLLKTQTMYKAYQPIKTDSQINISCDYYKRSNDKEKYARSLLYRGNVRADLGKAVEAMKDYKTAEEIMNDVDDDVLKHNIFFMISYVYLSHSEYSMALDNLKKAIKCATKTGRYDYLVYDNKQSAAIYYNMAQYDSCYYYINKSIQAIDSIPKRLTKYRSQLWNNLGVTYYKMNDMKNAKQALTKSLSIIPLGSAYATLAQISLKERDTIKAVAQLEEGLKVPDSRKIEMYLVNVLSQIEQERGNYQRATELSRRAFALKDSLARQQQIENVKALQLEMDHKREREQAKRARNWLLVGIGVIIVVGLGLMVMLIRRHRQQIAQEREQITELEDEKRQANRKLSKAQKTMSRLKRNQQEQDKTMRSQQKEWQRYGVAIEHGHQLWTELAKGANTRLWTNNDFKDFRTYYDSIDSAFAKQTALQYEPLSHNLYMLAALEHMGKSDDYIMAIMGLNLGAFRTTRTRLNQKRRSS